MVQDAVSSFLSVVKIVNEGKEGMQADMSFHQHGPQQQFGNYGLGFFENKDVHNGTIFALYIVHGKECSANKNISYIITPASDIPEFQTFFTDCGRAVKDNKNQFVFAAFFAPDKMNISGVGTIASNKKSCSHDQGKYCIRVRRAAM